MDNWGIKDVTNFDKNTPYSTDVSSLFNNYFYMRYFSALNAKNPNAVNDTMKKSFTVPFNQFVLSCFYAGNECTEKDFTWSYNLLFGNCYRFNSGYDKYGNKTSLLSTSKPGSIDGLRIHLNVAVPYHINSFEVSSAAHVFIHNDTIEPTTFEGIDISPGTHYSIRLGRDFIYQLPLPYNDCYNNLNTIDAFDSDIYRAIIQSNATYRQRDCYRLCFQKYLIQRCGCYDQNFMGLYGARPCTTLPDLFCSGAYYTDFYLVDIGLQCNQFW